MALSKLTPIERFISEIPLDPRRAYDRRQVDAGFKRVTVSVPVDHVEALKTFARLLRNETPEVIEMWRNIISDTLAGCYEDWDDAEKRGEL